MYIPQIMPKQIQSFRPSKRKIVKTIYTTEKFTKNIHKEKNLPNEARDFALVISDTCKNIRQRLTKQA